MDRTAVNTDQYQSKILKYIPAEVSAAFLSINSIITDAELGWVLIVSFFILFLITPVYLVRLQGVTNNIQVGLTTLAFPVWAANISADKIDTHFQNLPPVVFGVALILITLIFPLVQAKEVNP